MHHSRDASIVTRASIRGMLGVLLIAIGNGALALDPALQPSQYVLETWQTADGLPENSAVAIARTPDGYLWIGAEEGLARFDGVRFTVFDDSNESAIPGKYISVLHVDRYAVESRQVERVEPASSFEDAGRRPRDEGVVSGGALQDHLRGEAVRIRSGAGSEREAGDGRMAGVDFQART